MDDTVYVVLLTRVSQIHSSRCKQNRKFPKSLAIIPDRQNDKTRDGDHRLITSKWDPYTNVEISVPSEPRAFPHSSPGKFHWTGMAQNFPPKKFVESKNRILDSRASLLERISISTSEQRGVDTYSTKSTAKALRAKGLSLRSMPGDTGGIPLRETGDSDLDQPLSSSPAIVALDELSA